MAGFKQHRWYGDKLLADERRRSRIAVGGAAAETVVLCQAPSPIGWPRRTGFLAGSTQFEQPEETDEGVFCQVVARAGYAIYQHARDPVLQRNGDAMAQTLKQRFRQAR